MSIEVVAVADLYELQALLRSYRALVDAVAQGVVAMEPPFFSEETRPAVLDYLRGDEPGASLGVGQEWVAEEHQAYVLRLWLSGDPRPPQEA